MENINLQNEIKQDNLKNPETEPKDLRDVIANNIIKFRKKAKLTQAELAEKLNYSDKAVSKWERGDALPDIIVLNDIAQIFNVTLDSLVSNKEEKIKGAHKFFQKIYSSKMLACACASIIVWLIATGVFIFLSLLTELPNLWMTFIYALSVNSIVLVSLQFMWKNMYYNFFMVSFLIISIVISVYLTLYLYIQLDKVWLIFIILLPLLTLSWLWFIGRYKLKMYSRHHINKE